MLEQMDFCRLQDQFSGQGFGGQKLSYHAPLADSLVVSRAYRYYKTAPRLKWQASKEKGIPTCCSPIA